MIVDDHVCIIKKMLVGANHTTTMSPSIQQTLLIVCTIILSWLCKMTVVAALKTCT